MFVSIEGQSHFLTLAQGHLHMKIITGFSQKPVGHVIKCHDASHMTKMAAMTIYGKNLQKSSPEPKGR